MSAPLDYSGDSTENSESSQVTAPDQGVDLGAENGASPVESTEVIKDNPYWNNLLGVVPEQFHSQVKPFLKEWDRNYGKLADSYAPYKTFAQQNVTPETLNNAYQVYNMLNQNPQEMYRRLGEMLGVSPQQAQQVAQEVQQQQQQPESLYEDTSPQYQELLQRFNQMEQYQQQQQQQRQQEQLTSQYSRQLDAEISQIKQQHPNVNVGDMMSRFLAQMQRGEEPSMQRAFAEQDAFVQSIISQQKPAPPNVLAPGGGSVSGTEELSFKTQEDRTAAVEAMLRTATQQ